MDSGTWAVTGTGGLVVNQAKLDYTGARYMTLNPPRPSEVAPVARLSGFNGGTNTKLTVTGRTKLLS